MRSDKPNIAGLASARQHSEMKSILAGTWPPLKPLPVFKCETAAYRATIDFDKLRGEWVCRKTSFPSNMVQELRGGLREITMALPPSEQETFVEGSEQEEQEAEKDTNRRLQAIRDWKENSESGARYFELREYLSESQRAEIDDSLRLSLTARQLQFNARNVAYVFDALSTAGGRVATLIEFARRTKAKMGAVPTGQTESTAPEAEPAIGHDNIFPQVDFREHASVLTDNILTVSEQEFAEACADEIPSLSIKHVLPEPSFLADRMGHTPHECENSGPEIRVKEPASLVEQHCLEDRHSVALSVLTAEARMNRSSEDSWGSFSRLRGLEILALLFLFTLAALTIGLKLGGPFGTRLLGRSKATITLDAKSPTLPEQAHQSTSPPIPPPASPIESMSASKLDAHAKETESNVNSGPEVTPEQGAEIGPMASNAPPRAVSNPVPPREPVVSRSSAPGNPVPYGSARTEGIAPHPSRSTTILVNVPIRGSQPFLVNFPETAVAATSSLAITSQLSVLLLPKPDPIEADKPSRLEAGHLVSFVLPHYSKPRDGYGGAEVIKVRATIGPVGQIRDVRFLAGSTSLLPATIRAIRQWHYKPTLLDKRPIQSQQELTIEFRPSQYSSPALGRHPTQKLVAAE